MSYELNRKKPQETQARRTAKRAQLSPNRSTDIAKLDREPISSCGAHGRSARLEVFDDWVGDIPVSIREIKVIETYLGPLLAQLLERPAR